MLSYCKMCLVDADLAHEVATTAAESVILLIQSGWEPGQQVPEPLKQELGARVKLLKLQEISQGQWSYDKFLNQLTRQLVWATREQRKRDARRFRQLSAQDEQVASETAGDRQKRKQEEQFFVAAAEELKKMPRRRQRLLNECMEKSRAALAKEQGVSRATMCRRYKDACEDLKERVQRRLKESESGSGTERPSGCTASPQK